MKMKVNKKIALLLCVMMLTTLLAGCGGAKDNGGDKNADTKSSDF